MRRLALVVLLVALVSFPAVAAAVPPTRSEVDEDFEVVYEPCGLVEVGVHHRSFTTFLDQDGNAVRILEQVSFEGVITNPTTGETFVDRGHVTVTFKPDFTSAFTLTGTVFNIRVPKEGLLLLDAGRLVADGDFNTVFQSAKALSFSETDAAVCEALG